MRVCRNNKLDVSLASFPCPPRFHVEAMRIPADLDCRARFGDNIQYFLDAARNRRPPLHEPPQRMPPDFEERVLHRTDDPPGHLVLVEFVAIVNACDYHIE